MLTRLLCLLPVLFAGALTAQDPAPATAGKVVVAVRSLSPAHRHVGPRTHRYLVDADQVVAVNASVRRAPQTRPAASLRHLKGR